MKSLYCAANKLQGTFNQCFPAVKKHSFAPILYSKVGLCLPTVEQIHTG